MKTFLVIIQIVFAVVLISLILLQSSKGGLGSAFGGGEFYRTRRGAEKIVFWATVATAGIFLITSVFNLLTR
ncbi:MAG: preprotein translocase subunit SecG [Patescibacteria group bacterium]